MTENVLGQILLKNDLISQNQLIWALEQQHVENLGQKLLGEILVESKNISHLELRAALARQAQLQEIEFFSLQVHPSVRSKFKRSLDLLGATIGSTIFLILLPVIALAIVIDSSGPIFFTQYRVGLRGKQFRIWKFRTMVPNAEYTKWKVAKRQKYKFFDTRNDPRVTRIGKFLRRVHLDELPQFLNVLRGEMSLVGTRPPTLDEVKAYSRDDWQRLSVKPGVTGLWQTHRDKYSLNFEKVVDLDIDYAKRWSRQLDLKVIAKTVQQILLCFELGQSILPRSGLYEAKVPILNLEIDNLSSIQLLRQLNQGVVFTPNVDHLMQLQRDQDFYRVYHQADFKICDSQILVYASHFLGRPIRERISGSDFFPDFCQFHKDNESIRIFLLGGKQGVAKRAQARLNRRFRRQIVVDAHSPSFSFAENPQESQEIVARINQCQPTVLAVGVGAPKQEKWICQYKDKLPSVQIFLAIGATIDFDAGSKRRAPQWVSNMGVEWLYRLGSEPQRLWRRYLIDDIPFIWLLLKQKLGIYISPFEIEEPLSSDYTPRIKSRIL
jgi:N-acetylglucosaminyldiphosphoundecaprenol N-acetyl-beta-D-mannosaminyltransferase